MADDARIRAALRRDVDLSWIPKLRDVVTRLLWPLTPVVALLALFPWAFHDPDIRLDYSWSLVLQHAHLDGLVFGRDLMLNYGSWGFAFFGYLPETRSLVIVTWVVLSLLIAVGVAGATRSQSRGMTGLACAWAALLVLALPLPDPRVLAVAPILLALGVYDPDRKHLLPAEIALAAALGWVVTIKFSTFIITVAVLLSHSLDQWLLKRRVSPVIPVFVGSLLAVQLAAGEPPSALGEWIWSSMQNVVGYGTAGVASDRFHEKHPIPLFVAGAAALGFSMTAYLFRARRWKAVVPLTALALTFGVLLKAGYMRHDAGHQINAPLVFLVLVLLLAPGMLAKGGRPEKLLFAVALAIAIYSANLAVDIDRRRDLHIAVSEQLSRVARGVSNFAGEEKGIREFHERKMERIRKKYPLPPGIAEPVDVYSYMQSVALAHGLKMSPRPAFQSYFAWTPFLAGANAKHLEGPRAPATILFAIEPIDKRFPTFDDSLSYPALLSRYEAGEATGDFLLLTKRPAPLRVSLRPVVSVDGRVGETIAVPATLEPLWATVRVRLTPKGRLIRLILRPPELRLLAEVGGEVENYRFIPDYGEMGFVISPVPRDHLDVRRIFLGEPAGERAMTSFRITTGSAEDDRALIEPEIRVEFSAISIERAMAPGAVDRAGVAGEGPPAVGSPSRQAGR